MTETAERDNTSNPPTEKMLNFARSIASSTGIELPKEAQENFEACKGFIDENKDKTPPSDKQKSLAEKIAKEKGVEIPQDVLASKVKTSEWIDQNKDS